MGEKVKRMQVCVAVEAGDICEEGLIGSVVILAGEEARGPESWWVGLSVSLSSMLVSRSCRKCPNAVLMTRVVRSQLQRKQCPSSFSTALSSHLFPRDLLVTAHTHLGPVPSPIHPAPILVQIPPRKIHFRKPRHNHPIRTDLNLRLRDVVI